MSAHNDHRTGVYPDADNLEYRPWCLDCETFYAWEDSEYDKHA